MRRLRAILLLLAVLLSRGSSLAQDSRHLLMLDGVIAEDSIDTDARTYMPVADADDRLCALLKVSSDNPLASELTLTGPGLPVKKYEEIGENETWFWISPSATEISFLCLNYNEIGPLVVNFSPGKVYRAKLHAEKVKEKVPGSYFANSIAFRVTNSTINTTLHYGRTPDCEMGTLHFRQDHSISVTLPYGKYYVMIADNLSKTISGVASVTENYYVDEFSLKPDYGYFKFISTPVGAKIYINDCFIGVTPFATSTKYTGGEYKIKITADNYYDLEDNVTLNGNGSVQTFQYDLRPRFGKLTVSCPDPLASIYVDGRYVGKSNWSGAVSGQGAHIVEARREGYRTQTVNVVIADGQSVTESLPAPVQVYGSLNITSSPSHCSVYINDEKIGTTPLTINDMPAGTHTIQLSKSGYYIKEFEANVHEGVLTECSHTLTKNPSTPGPVSMKWDIYVNLCPSYLRDGSDTYNIGGVDVGFGFHIPMNKTRLCFDLGMASSLFFSTESTSSSTSSLITLNLPFGIGYMIGSKLFRVYPYVGLDPVIKLSSPEIANVEFSPVNLMWHAGCNFCISCFLVGAGYRASFFPVVKNSNIQVGQFVISVGLTF